MTLETLEKANEIQSQLVILQKECERIPRQYLDWRDDTKGYWKRMLVSVKNKLFIKFPQRYEGDTNVLMELSKEDLQCIVENREKKIKILELELKNLGMEKVQ